MQSCSLSFRNVNKVMRIYACMCFLFVSICVTVFTSTLFVYLEQLYLRFGGVYYSQVSLFFTFRRESHQVFDVCVCTRLW